jgi:hypothetical protein
MMRGATLPRRAVKAFRSAGATEEMIASARLIYGSLPNEPPGRPRMYKTPKEADHAYYERHRDRIIKLEANRRKNRKNKAPEPEEEARERRIAQLVEAALPLHFLTLAEARAIHFSTSSEKSFPKLAGKYREAQVGNRAFSLSAATRSRAAPVAGKCGIAASERLRRRNKLWKLPRWARNCIGFLTSFASSSCRGLRGMLN